jgi:hypothetical protein
MKRVPPKDMRLRPKRFEFDPEKAYKKKQLAKMGALSIAWNQVESSIDWLGSWILFPASPFYLKLEAQDVISFSGKVALLRACATNAKLLNDEAKRCIKLTLDGVLECRTYRNAVIHSHIYDHKKGIASYTAENGKPYQVMVSYEALSGLYDRLVLLKRELMEIDLLLRMELEPTAIKMISPTTGQPEFDQRRALLERGVPNTTRQVLHHQKERRSLPPLPLFPDARRVRPKKADAESRPHPEGRGQA